MLIASVSLSSSCLDDLISRFKFQRSRMHSLGGRSVALAEVDWIGASIAPNSTSANHLNSAPVMNWVRSSLKRVSPRYALVASSMISIDP